MSTRQPVDIRRFPWMRRLAIDYAFHFENLAPFYAGDPKSSEAWSRAIGRAQGHPRPRAEVAEVLLAQQRHRGAPAAAQEAAQLLRDSATVSVVTGQQAGLFGGPLFTLLKAVTALKLAERTRREHGVPAIAMFWIDAEDHDWDEVATSHVLDPDYHLRSITLPKPPGAGELPVARVRLEPTIDRTLEQLKTSLAATAFTDELSGQLRDAYRPGYGMSEAFGRWLEQLLGPHGLVVFDCSDPASKPLVAPVFARELESPGVTSALAAETGAQLEQRGYHAQVTASPENAALFYLDGVRAPLKRVGDRFVIGNDTVPAAALVERARESPQQFSPNVLLRPLVQDTLFPTICYVAGPSELAYLAQLGRVYQHFDLPMPLVFPRATATLLDSAAARFLNRYDIPLESLQPQGEASLNRLLQSQLPPSIESSLVQTREAVQQKMQAVIGAVPVLDPTLEGAARSTLGRMEHDLQTLHAKIIHAAKRRDETLRRQYMRTQAQAFPDGQPQERTLGIVHFLNQYGPALVDVLKNELMLDPGQHLVLTM